MATVLGAVKNYITSIHLPELFPNSDNNNNDSSSNSNIVVSLRRNLSSLNRHKRNSSAALLRLGSGCVGFGVPKENKEAEDNTSEEASSIEEQAEVQQRPRRRHLPLPTGPYVVGCVDLMSDVSDSGVFYRLYYPTKKTDIKKSYKQWPLWLPRKHYAYGYIYFLKKNKMLGKLANLIGGEIYVPVLWQAPLLKSQEKFPVLIVSHGIGGNRTTLTTYCYELASYGYVVAALEHRDGSASMTLCLQDNSTVNIREHYLRLSHSDTALATDGNEDLDMVEQERVKFYVDEEENTESQGGRGARVKQMHQNNRRSVINARNCTEEWRRFKHVEVWDDFNLRNGQMYHRTEEISKVLDELTNMTQGNHVYNKLDLAFKTNQFKDRLDLERVAIIGHSFGGAATLATLAVDERFKVGISLDGWMHPLDDFIDRSVKQPCLLLNMEDFQWERNVNRMIKFQKAKESSDRPMITLKGGCHQSMTDFQFIVPQLLGRLLDVCYTLAPKLAMSACVNVSLAFLAKHLFNDQPLEQKHKDILDCKHPHLILGTNVDLTIPDNGPTPP
ncbi:platelet-activating factor acetylhydrolase-like [Biomphalaria glabrata]|uniref:1-alkyl-2-acetylglycerophosphocholine esterase n=1 Tax=Biomphalaria glabrata TaxID=6526 RepID=A0A9U8EJN7_BIOGL|nr:platelet-activating factor acetylhydrolase-like [Biomphalaria glabrata]KAI8736810.1 platelet-activating factor acetylhydrolase-like [Biomphalaria glabrata]